MFLIFLSFFVYGYHEEMKSLEQKHHSYSNCRFSLTEKDPNAAYLLWSIFLRYINVLLYSMYKDDFCTNFPSPNLNFQIFMPFGYALFYKNVDFSHGGTTFLLFPKMSLRKVCFAGVCISKQNLGYLFQVDGTDAQQIEHRM